MSQPEGASPPNVDDHVFRPRGQWWSLCGICNLSEAAHKFVCDLCQGKPVDNAARYTNPDAPEHATCPRCGAFEGVPA